MNPSATYEPRNTHPLSGLESWPKTGPVYGLDSDENPCRATTLWQRIGNRFRTPPTGGISSAAQARIWY